ncbi:glycosyltransferase [Paenibacillus sanguinis]|uniref:glycosyltransferase n=1 Tax=Paenibacillus sanguinis TaxID=225906 RepID=UPI0023E3CC4F|nr:glycosyltransferase [Paenibacillus sanguinis]
MENGIDLGRFSGVEPWERKAIRAELGAGEQAGRDTFVWLAVGRLVPAKDYPLMLRAFAAARSKGFPASRLWIAGIGPERERVEQEAAALGLADSVALLGIRQDIPRLMAAADGYVMSSRWEGLPIVLLEACAARLPIVATAVGGNAEVVLDGKNGYVVPPLEERGLAEALERVMALPAEKRRALGQCGREHVEAHYAMSRAAGRWFALYEQLSGCKMAEENATFYSKREGSEG